ncbi:hypothetical protein Q5W90_04565 [Borreliella burgdorferi]|uniref:hypothetical protein n=1 Tax=Borreliella burgdorferi TaxID=139 RepID=UPI0026F45F18|nr:hypothetical protein [Borreliella burgdorferi]MDO7279458.1 hypothetical protein [Borreliella burgdorferi]
MITQKDYTEIKKRLEKTKTLIQFRNGNKIDSLGYEGSLGEPILLKDKLTFSVCDGKSIDNRKEYEITKNTPNLDSLSEYLEHMTLFFLRKTPVGALTAKFAQEGSSLKRSKLIEAFTSTNKFCIPDGRSLPSNCYAYKVLGISYAPNLSGRFLRHYDSSNSRSLGNTQSDTFESHRHDIDNSRINFKGATVGMMVGTKRVDPNWYWDYGNTRFYTMNTMLSDYIGVEHLSVEYTDYYNGLDETRPKNTCYISFYRYDL